MPKDNNLEMACHLKEFLEQLEGVSIDRASFNLGEYGYHRADRVQEIADRQAKLRSSLEGGYDETWFDSVPDRDALFWAVGGIDVHVDILRPYNEDRKRLLLPGATPIQYDRRNTRLRSVVLAALG